MKYKRLSLAILVITCSGCGLLRPSIDLKDPNMTIQDFALKEAFQQKAGDVWYTSQPNACGVGLKIRMQYISTSFEEIISRDYDNYCKIAKKGVFKESFANSYTCKDLNGQTIFDVKISSKNWESTYLKTTARTYTYGDAYVDVVLPPSASTIAADDGFRKSAVKFDPIIYDQSGFFMDTNVGSFYVERVEPKTLKCDSKTEEITYRPVFQPSYSLQNYSYELLDLPGVIKYSDSNVIIRPKVSINKKMFSTFEVNTKYENKYVSAVIKSIDLYSHNVKMSFMNKSATYADVNAISLYLDDKIYTVPLHFEIPPDGMIEKTIEFPAFNGSISGRILIDAAAAKTKDVEIGLSLKISVGGKDGTFLKKQKFKMYDLISSL